MKNSRTLPFVAIACALALLSACNGSGDNAAEAEANVAAAEPEAPPPMIVKTTPYRCKDSSVFTADFFNDNKTVNIRIGDAELGKQLIAETPGPDTTYVSPEGYELVVHGSTADLTTPDKPKQLCKS